jgi:sugar O-acyltransferase (sialic acid O-acetyltransferase NeuD family)
MKILKKKTLVIYGAGSLGKETLQLVKILNLPRSYSKMLFIDKNLAGQKIYGFEVFSLDQFLSLKIKSFDFLVAIADSKLRRVAAEKLNSNFGNPINLISKQSNFLDSVTMGRGNIIFPGTTISTDVKIGDFVIVNANAYIGHDCSIGNYVTISPCVTVCGNVEIENEVFIGANTSIIQGSLTSKVQIGENSILGMGTNILTSVSASRTLVGNPARDITKS